MGVFTVILPDVGEGIAEAELTEWAVKIGGIVQEDDILCVVMTDKAAIEVPSSVDGKVTWLAGEVGDVIAIGSELVKLDVEGDGNKVVSAPDKSTAPVPEATTKPKQQATTSAKPDLSRPEMVNVTRRAEGEKPIASPAVRKRALDAGVDLRQVMGPGPAGVARHRARDGPDRRRRQPHPRWEGRRHMACAWRPAPYRLRRCRHPRR